MTRLALVSDTWLPEVNGVVTTLTRLADHLESIGFRVLRLTPGGRTTVPLPTSPEIRLSLAPWEALRELHHFRPDAVHIATSEGPLGLWTNLWLRQRGLRFTTSFHTRLPEYLNRRLPVPVSAGYVLERWLHRAATHTLVGTRSMADRLAAAGVGRRLVPWPRGVDCSLFHPDQARDETYRGLPRPIWLYVGRVAVEKTLDEFLRLPLDGTKVIVGDAYRRATREDLTRRFPGVVWRGWRFGEDLARHYASADCFVFPSRTDTFGNVLLEALASGLPVAGVPAPGPTDLIVEGVNGSVSDDLHAACRRALRCSRDAARASAQRYTFQASHDVFLNHLVPLRRETVTRSIRPGAGEAALCRTR
jgi:glycosyltransferase involved in cell wall biosynthesis